MDKQNVFPSLFALSVRVCPFFYVFLSASVATFDLACLVLVTRIIMNSGQSKNCGVRMTRQRSLILQILRTSESHPTADALYESVRRHIPRISLATVYRNLDLLVASGQAKRVRMDDGPARFDGHVEPHHHVRCVQCGRIADAPAEVCRVRTSELQESTGYDLLDCHVEICGLCPDCKAAREEKSRPESRV